VDLRTTPLNVLVFGASGGTGRELVNQAREQGHAVTAFVREPKKFEIKDANLRVVQGERNCGRKSLSKKTSTFICG
jgi:nucleoside-diphosphate-sugar epimerase